MINPIGYTYNGTVYHLECLPVGVASEDEEVGAIFNIGDAGLLAEEEQCECGEPLLFHFPE